MTDATDNADFRRKVNARRTARMAMIDNLPKDIRELVHVYGLNIVNACLQQGVTRAKGIRHIVETVLDEASPTRGSFSSQGARTPYIEKAKSA